MPRMLAASSRVFIRARTREDVLALDLLHGPVAAQPRLRCVMASDALGQRLRLNHLGRTQDHGTFHRVAQFADVAGPAVTLEDR